MEDRGKIAAALAEAREIVKGVVDESHPEYHNYVRMVFDKMMNTNMGREWAKAVEPVFERIYPRQPSAVPMLGGIVSAGEPSQEDIGVVDAFMENLEPEIKEIAVAMIREEIRDKLLLGGHAKKIKEALTKKRRAKIKRKKGCVFLELGEGTPTDPTDSIMVWST